MLFDASKKSSPMSNTVLFLGHRGSSHRYPENTMLAFEKAVSEGASGIETDIRKTADDVYVLIHDPMVDRTTNGSGAVSDLTWKDITALDAGAWKGPEFSGRGDTQVLRLDNFLDHFKGKPVFLCLQVKLDLSDCLTIVDMVKTRGMLNQCFLFADQNNLASIKAYNHDTFVINDGMNHNSAQLLARAKAEGWNAISPGVSNVSKELVKEANAHGIYVMGSYLSSNYQSATQSLIDIGCNFILGNDCKAMVSIGLANGVQQIEPL